MGKRLLVIGGGMAGIHSAVMARSESPEMEIKVITSDRYVGHAYYDLPSYIGDDENVDALLGETLEVCSKEYRIDFLTGCSVTQILPQERKVVISKQEGGEFRYEYDKLIIAAGAKPVIPSLDGINLQNVFFIYKVEDALKIHQQLNQGSVHKAVVVGGSPLGLEIAENLFNKDVPVTLVEPSGHILPGFDEEIADLAQKVLEEKGIEIITNESVLTLIGNTRGEVVEVHTPNHILPGDLVIWTSDSKPNAELAQKAGIEIGESGAILVNGYLQTSLSDIYAVGACAEVKHTITRNPVWNTAGSAVYRTARIAGKNVCREDAQISMEGVLNTISLRIFGMTVARTGLSAREAEEAGYEVETAIGATHDAPSYYAIHRDVVLKLIADRKSHCILGAQIIGEEGVDQCVDILAVSAALKGTLDDLMVLDLSYPPMVSPAVAAVSMAADILMDKLAAKIKGISSRQLHEMLGKDDLIVLDVRSAAEVMLGTVPGAVHISAEELEDRFSELDSHKKIVIISKGRDSAHQSSMLLTRKGFSGVSILDGGVSAYPYRLE